MEVPKAEKDVKQFYRVRCRCFSMPSQLIYLRTGTCAWHFARLGLVEAIERIEMDHTGSVGPNWKQQNTTLDTWKMMPRAVQHLACNNRQEWQIEAGKGTLDAFVDAFVVVAK